MLVLATGADIENKKYKHYDWQSLKNDDYEEVN